MFQRIGLGAGDKMRKSFSGTGGAEQAANSKLHSDSNPAAAPCCAAVSSSACIAWVCLLDIKSGFRGPHHARNPQRPPQSSRTRSRPRKRLPLPINGKGTIRIDEDVAVAIIRACFFHAHHLVPAVHAADGI